MTSSRPRLRRPPNPRRLHGVTAAQFKARLRESVRQGGSLDAIAARVVVGEDAADTERLSRLAREIATRYYGVKP